MDTEPRKRFGVVRSSNANSSKDPTNWDPLHFGREILDALDAGLTITYDVVHKYLFRSLQAALDGIKQTYVDTWGEAVEAKRANMDPLAVLDVGFGATRFHAVADLLRAAGDRARGSELLAICGDVPNGQPEPVFSLS